MNGLGPRLTPHACAHRLLFLDFEASSLVSESWPVELGWALIANGRVEVYSTLIAPRQTWSIAAWSSEAERVHGISLAALDDAPSADVVAKMTDAFADFHIVSTNADWDGLWLNRLREDRTPLRVHAFRDAASQLDHPARDRLASALFRLPAPHRAGADAARLAEGWLAATSPNMRAA